MVEKMNDTMEKLNLYNEDDRQYLQMMQSNIERMAANSANCKIWMVAFVTAFMALGSSIAVARYWHLLGIIPILLFWYLDTFYLHLERAMRNRERDFLNKIAAGDNEGYKTALFNFKPMMVKKEDAKDGLVATNDRWFSSSIAPFYCIAIIAVLILPFVIK